MYDIITFGSASRDIFLVSKKFYIINGKKFITGKGICLPLGSKINVENVVFSTGGGATNTAATFSRQKLKTAYCGMIGDDLAGKTIYKEIRKLGIDTSFISKTKKKPTNHSVFFSYPKKDRTILVYRGASSLLKKSDILWNKLKSKWFYINSFSGKSCALFEFLIDWTKKNRIKIAVNPGKYQLCLPQKTLKRIFKKIDILILNQEEASILAMIPFQKEKEILKKLDRMTEGIIVMTKGQRGVVVSNGKYIYKAKIIPSKVVDRTGAGDSFGSGFVSEFSRSNNIKRAIQFGTANASACLEKWGAKEGLLKKGQPFIKVKVIKNKL